MATLYWLDVNGNFNDTANWSTSRGGAGGSGPPTTGDTAYIESGNKDIYTSSSVTGVTALYVTAGFTGAFGTAAAAAQVAGTTLVLSHSGPAYVTGGWTTAKSSSQTGQTHTFSGSVTVTTLQAGQAGTVIVGSGITNTTIRSSGAKVVIKYGAGSGPTTVLTAGNVECERSVGSIEVMAGSRTLFYGTAGAITTSAKIYSGGTMVYNSPGTIASLEIRPGGVFDSSQNPYPITVTSRTAWAGSSYTNKTGAGDITFSGSSDVPV